MTSSAEASAPESPSARARAVLALVIAGTALVVIDMTIVTIGLPEIQADLGGTLASIQWVVVAYMITMGAVTQVVGTLSDRLGRRKVYLAGIALFTLASLACGLANSTTVLDLARVAQGIGGAILMVNALPLLAHQFEGQRRNMAITKWSTVATAASLIAPLLGGVLVDALGWRAIFLINVPFGIVAYLMGLRTLPEDAPFEGKRGSIDWTGTVLLIAALAVGNFALLRGEEQGWSSVTTLTQFAATVVFLAVFFVVQTKAEKPTLDLKMFRKPAFTGSAIAIFMSRVLTIGGTVYFVQYFQNSLHLSPTESGLLLAPVFIAQIVAGIVGGKMLGVLAPGYVIATGYICKAIGALWLALVFSPTVTPWLLAFPLLVWGTGGGIAGAPVMAVAMNVTDKERAGMVAGTITSLASIGAGIGTAVLGVLYTSRIGDVIAADPALDPTTRDAIVEAASNGDTQRVLELTPAESRVGMEQVIADGISTGATAVLFTSGILAVVTTAIVLVLISKRNAPMTPKKKPATKEEPATDLATKDTNS
ncbi:MAG: MFS transporter [Actinophytocola sp.]|uniref:MFS transporter n=1 Tax=Actinophytocola sp. TaxID=1872138 RepID=UPI003C712D1D